MESLPLLLIEQNFPGILEIPYVPGRQKKEPAAPYSPAGESRSTLGEEALDFRVRNGNGYDSLSMATGKRFAEPAV